MKKRIKKTILKLSVVLISIGIIGFFSLNYYTSGIWENYIKKENLSSLIQSINSTPQLPDNLKNSFEAVYPNIFKSNVNSYVSSQLLSRQIKTPCPSHQVSSLIIYSSKSFPKHQYEYGLLKISIARKLEKETTQQKCWSYYLNNYDFTHGIKGINQLVKHYYNKPIKELTLDEQLEIILMVKQPILYNKTRPQNKLEEKVKELKEKITITHR